jgi:hypothetical protein
MANPKNICRMAFAPVMTRLDQLKQALPVLAALVIHRHRRHTDMQRYKGADIS